MLQKKILVPLGLSGKDLKSVHYALSLAERIEAQVYILQQDDGVGSENPLTLYMGEALSDLIKHAARSKPQQHHLNDIAPKIPSNRTMRAIGG